MKTIQEKAKRFAKQRVILDNRKRYGDESSLRSAEYDSYKSYVAGFKEAMRWRDPKEELPEEGVVVFVKILSSCGAGDEVLYTSSSVVNNFFHSADADPFGCEGYYPAWNGGRVRFTVIGWRPIG